jgi:sensor histidine kinase YesM
MKAATFFTPKIRKGIIHLVVLTIVIIFFMNFFISRYDTFLYNRWSLYAILTNIFAFYVHSLLLLPILIEKKNLKKYLTLSLGCFILIAIVHSWDQAVNSSLITYHVDGTRPVPLEFFLQKNWIMGGAIVSFPMFIIVGVISFIYYLLIHQRKIFLPYLEILFHAVILLAIFAFAVINPHMRTKEILSVLVVLSVFYINTFLITPVLIKDKKKPKYVYLLIALSASFYILIFKILGNLFRYTQTEEDVFYVIVTLIFVLLITLFLSFVYGYVRHKTKVQEKLFGLKLEAKESELNLLKSQVNPHFLFNSLNTLYATALAENAPKTGESIAKLASLIRYMQEDINKNFIPLQNEIKYLQDYIAIQKLRCAVEPQVEVRFENFENHSISPGLLIPFVENAFKYGIDPSKPSKLEVAVCCDENKITFECVNSYDENYKTYYKELGFGIGIENAKQRLELVYPKKHTFEIVKENGIFSVKIVINTSKK